MIVPCASSAEKSPLRIASVGTVRVPGSGNSSYSHSTAPKKNVAIAAVVEAGNDERAAKIAAGAVVGDRRFFGAAAVDEEVRRRQRFVPHVVVALAFEQIRAALQRDVDHRAGGVAV